MGDGTAENPFTRKDVLRLIEENGGTAKRLSLSWKWFETGINLSKLNLEGINLKHALFVGANLSNTNLSSSQLKGVNIVVSNLQDANLEYTNLEGAQLLGTNLCGTVLTLVEFSSVKFGDINWGNYILGEEKAGHYYSAEETYRRLKIWYREHGMYDIAEKFFYREMEAKRKAQSWKSEPLSKLWSWVMRLLCGYGERYGNVVVVALVIVFGLAVVYGFGGLNLAYAIYFSAVSFTALGYGKWVDITPPGWVQGLGAFESFLGVFMMALFLVTFIRKMTR